MEMESPPPCPYTVTLRRNPPRKARATPASAVPFRKLTSPTSLSRNIFATEILHNPNNINDKATDSSTRDLSESLKVFLRIRPLTVQKQIRSIAEPKNAWPKNPRVKGNTRPKIKSSEVCVHVNEDLRSVTISTPQALQEMKRVKSEVHEGFSHVFAPDVSQIDVYEEMVKPLVEDFLKGKSGMLAAMGPSGSGKTHTVFGCAREPGMVPLALRRIFGDKESTVTLKSRVFYLSMFEISSEKGKAERMTDLLHDGGEISMQQSVIKGLQEALVSDAQQADSLIAKGMLKRLTATTSSNSQSSRSQCIINIRRDCEVDGNASSSILTIVDLAGAEREKRTGNQGARLLESNFINNTSMVFGQCLRSLLEHQKSRNKPPLQKHYKNSLLTRYLQDYLEGKKRMALILTVKPGVEDYLDTSFLLRQASPFTKIKFKTVDGPVNVTCNKRINQTSPLVMQPKKMKFSNSASLIDEGNTERGPDLNMHKEVAGKVIKGCLNQNNEETHDAKIDEIHVLSDGFVGLRIQEKMSPKGDHGKPIVEKDREYRIMQGFSKALWTVLKQYKKKLEGLEMENCNLRYSLATEQRRNLDLVNEMTREKMRLADLESRFCILQENSENLSYSSNQLEKTDPSARDTIVTFASPSAGPEYHNRQQIEDLVQSSEGTQITKGVKDPSEVDICSNCSSSQDLIFHEDICIMDMPLRSQATVQSTSGSLYTSHRPEEDVGILGYVENIEPESKCVLNGSFATSLDYEESTKTTQHSDDLKDAKQEPAQPENSATGPTFKACIALDCEESAVSTQHSEDLNDAKKEPAEDVVDILGYVENLELESKCVSDGSSFDTSLDYEESTRTTQHSEDLKDAKQEAAQTENSATGPTSQACIALDCEESAESTQCSEDLKDAKQEPEEDVVDILGYVKNLEPESKCVSNGSSFVTSLEHEESNRNTQHSEDLNDAKKEPAEDVVDILGYVENLELESKCVSDGSSFDTSLDYEESTRTTQHSEDLKDAKQEAAQTENSATGPTSQACIALDCEESAESTQCSEDLKDAKQEPEEDVVDILGYVKNLEPESKCVSNGSSFVTSLEHEESNKNTQHSEDLQDAKQETVQFEKSATGPTVETCILLDCEESAESTQHSEDLKDAKLKPAQLGNGNDLSLVEQCKVPGAACSQTALGSSEFPWRDNTSYHVDEEQCNNVESKLEPPVTGLPEEVPDAINEVKLVQKANNFQNTEKPKRRLQPASSVLLKDISLLTIDDENDRLKRGKVGKRGKMDDKKRTQGSLSLLNLLTR